MLCKACDSANGRHRVSARLTAKQTNFTRDGEERLLDVDAARNVVVSIFVFGGTRTDRDESVNFGVDVSTMGTVPNGR